MKKLILLAGVASLTACADTAVEEEAPAEDVAMEAAADEASMAPDGGTTAGTYSIRDMDGNEVGRTVVNDDMTYTWTPADGEAVNGTLSFAEDGGPCFTPDGSEEGACFPPTAAEDVAEDGSWPSHDENGEVNGTVIRVDA